ncbi:hypothetical protein HALDL1_09655 [Halobacterium sp. DL1]|jgi:hypothetical protein|nr:hypothetical protein HALDL1_09655 [Halobacterium sp. DL1]
MTDPDSGSSIARRAFEIVKIPVRGVVKSAKFLDKVADGLISIKDHSIMTVTKEGVRVINEAYDDVFRGKRE